MRLVYGAFMMLAGYLLGRGTLYRFFVRLRNKWRYRVTPLRLAQQENADLRTANEDLVIRLEALNVHVATVSYDAVLAFAAYLVALNDANITSNEEWMAARVEEFCRRKGWWVDRG